MTKIFSKEFLQSLTPQPQQQPEEYSPLLNIEQQATFTTAIQVLENLDDDKPEEVVQALEAIKRDGESQPAIENLYHAAIAECIKSENLIIKRYANQAQIDQFESYLCKTTCYLGLNFIASTPMALAAIPFAIGLGCLSCLCSGGVPNVEETNFCTVPSSGQMVNQFLVERMKTSSSKAFSSLFCNIWPIGNYLKLSSFRKGLEEQIARNERALAALPITAQPS